MEIVINVLISVEARLVNEQQQHPGSSQDSENQYSWLPWSQIPTNQESKLGQIILMPRLIGAILRARIASGGSFYICRFQPPERQERLEFDMCVRQDNDKNKVLHSRCYEF